MAENTDRFGLNTYSQGDTNWDHTDTVQTIDELAIERGTVADRPDSGDYDDELYLATDQQILYRWDADAADWIVEGVGSETDPLPNVWANEIDVNTLEAEQTSTTPLLYHTIDEYARFYFNNDIVDSVGESERLRLRFETNNDSVSRGYTIKVLFSGGSGTSDRGMVDKMFFKDIRESSITDVAEDTRLFAANFSADDVYIEHVGDDYQIDVFVDNPTSEALNRYACAVEIFSTSSGGTNPAELISADIVPQEA